MDYPQLNKTRTIICGSSKSTTKGSLFGRRQLDVRSGGRNTRLKPVYIVVLSAPYVTHQELQRYENERFRVELGVKNVKKHSNVYLIAGNPKALSSHSPERNPVPSKKSCGRPWKKLISITCSDAGPTGIRRSRRDRRKWGPSPKFINH